MRIRQFPFSLVMVLFLVGCSPLRGCVESRFSVVTDDRLPAWFTLPAGSEPSELDIEIRFYTNGDAIVDLYGPEPDKIRLESVVTRKTKPTSGSYPRFIHLEANGQKEIFAAIRMEPLLFLIDAAPETEADRTRLLIQQMVYRENQLGKDQCQYISQLMALADIAYKVDDFEASQKYSSQLLQCDTYPGITHSAHIIYGRALLRAGNQSAAGKQLVAACQVESTPALSTFGPNMLLAQELLKAGERDIVIDYLDYCQLIWTSGATKLKRWKEQIRSGDIPNFGANVHY